MTGVEYEVKSALVLCYLKDCYYQLARKSIMEYSNCGAQNYQRDFIWTTLNVLRYLAEKKKFYEA